MIEAAKGALWGALIAGLAALGLGIWGMWERSQRLEAEKSELALRVKWEQAVSAGERAVREANEKYAALEDYWRQRQKGVERERELERQANADRLESERRAADRRVLQLTAYATGASGGAQAAQDTLAACHQRATDLAGALEEALRAHAECTGTAENLAGDVRTLLGAWPTAGPAEVAP